MPTTCSSAGRGLRGARKAEVGALIRLAVQFESWRALCREGGLADEAAAELMVGLVDAACDAGRSRSTSPPVGRGKTARRSG